MDPVQPSPPVPAPLPQDLAPFCALHPSVRAEQACSRCGAFACRACLRSTPEGLPLCVTCDTREGATDLPWDQRERLGTVSAFARTCWAIVWHPGQTLDRATPQGSIGSSLGFVVLAQITQYLATGLLYTAMAGVFLGLNVFGDKKGAGGLTPATTTGITVGFIVLMVIMVIGLGMVAALILAGLDHLVLKAIGARPRPYQVTLRAHALSMAPCLAGLVPLCGLYVAPVWMLVVRIFAYRGLHRISSGKAALGALAVPGLFIALMVGSYAAIFAVALASGRGNL